MPYIYKPKIEKKPSKKQMAKQAAEAGQNEVAGSETYYPSKPKKKVKMPTNDGLRSKY
jgi:hypothetical protein